MATKKKRKANTGELIWRKNGYSARYRRVVDGVAIRKCVPLGTDNKAVAQAKLNRLIAGTSVPESIKTEVETFKQAARRIVAEQTHKTVKDRMSRLETYAYPKIGNRPVDGLRTADFRDVLDGAVEAGLARGTILHLRQDMASVLDTLLEYDVITENVVKRVRIPKNAKVDERPRVILTDDEFVRFLAWPDLDSELRLLALVSRCFGGMRTSDLHAWRWKHIDTINWVDAYVPRPKTRSTNRLGLPALIVPELQAWWKAAGCPAEGPVFPGAGGHQRANSSHAARLRKALWEARVRRGPTKETCALQSDTQDTLRVDFHSFRRAFNTALAAAGINIQTAMKLAGHKSTAVHMRYVLQTESIAMPERALPDLTRAPAVPILKAMDLQNSVNTAAPAIAGGVHTSQLNARTYSFLLDPSEIEFLGETPREQVVPTTCAHAADAALSAYLKVLASSFAQRSAS